MRKTKIVCTIGPASESEEIIKGLCTAGMNVARLNFSHSNYEEHQYRIDMIKKVRSDLNLPIAIMLDTKGPEYRIKTFKDQKINLNAGDKFTFTTENVIGDETRVSVNYKNLPDELSVGDTILLNNGLLTFEVVDINGTSIECVVVIGGELSNRKSMSFPGKVMKQEYLSEQDKKDIAFGAKNDVDYIACSFVSNKQDLLDVRNYLKEIGAKNIELIAKIENQSGVDNIESICEVCDGIMIARG
ncbi:MAG: pyruvate kinase, partial [Clostridia bacterium]|nr:pyruvate kinase [Clostridia bacterium]